MWVSGRVTDFIRMPGEPPLASKVAKFLLLKGECPRSKFATATVADDSVADDLSDEGISVAAAGAELSN